MSFFCKLKNIQIGNSVKILFIDTETTGLSAKPGMNELVQIGGYITENRNILESVSIKSQPKNWNSISKQALEVTNLTIDILKSYNDPKDSFDIFYTSISKFIGNERIKIAGQNVKFDIRFTELWWNTWKPELVPEFNKVFDVNDPYELMDITKTLKDMGILVVDNIKLGTVARALRLDPVGELHDAMTDIDLTYRTMFDLIDRINHLNNDDISRKFTKYMNLK